MDATTEQDKTRRKLIESALKILDKKPSSQISYREIATVAGFSHMTAYRHFRTLDDIFEAVAEEGYRKLILELRQCIEKYKDNPKKLLQQVFISYFYFGYSHPHHLAAMYDRGDRKGKYKRVSFLESTQELLKEYLNVINICRKGGLFSPIWNESELGLIFWSFSHGYTILETKAELKLVMHSRPDAEEFLKKSVDAFLGGLERRK